MDDCALCGEPVLDERPDYWVSLEIEDTTRSTSQFMGDETDIKRISLTRQLCIDCQQDLVDRLD